MFVIGVIKELCCLKPTFLGSLPENQQQILQGTTFKELFLYRQDICTILINTLVDSYLGDNASVDSISNKLMEVCPHLYKPEDAAFSKVFSYKTVFKYQQLEFSRLMNC